MSGDAITATLRPLWLLCDEVGLDNEKAIARQCPTMICQHHILKLLSIVEVSLFFALLTGRIKPISRLRFSGAVTKR